MTRATLARKPVVVIGAGFGGLAAAVRLRKKGWPVLLLEANEQAGGRALRQVFTFQPLLVGGDPYDVTSIYMLIQWLERKWGVHFSKGGTGALVQALVRLFEDIGGELRRNTPVSEMVLDYQMPDAAGGERQGVPPAKKRAA